VRFARVLALVLVCLLAGLATAAYADPPDPSWIGGYWDDDDFDNVVVFLLGTYAVVELPQSDTWYSRGLVAFIERLEPLAIPAPVDATASPRAPPLTSSSS
jgi:hypothetical protein